MRCLIKNIPKTAKDLIGTGNKGLFFPVTPICQVLPQYEIEEDFCTLAVELSSLENPSDSDDILSEMGLWVFDNDYRLVSDCPPPLSAFCYLVLEEDGETAFERIEPEFNSVFLVNCR